jgi:Domain of unknown function (DUF6089)
MAMTKTFYFSILFMILGLYSTHLSAQNYELGLFGGTTNYQGDLADGAIVWQETQPAAGLLIRYSPKNFLAFRVGFTYGKLLGDDKYASNPQIRQRGYSFVSNVKELAILSEFHLPNYGSSSYGMFKVKFSPFGFVGVGLTNINGQPQAPKDRVPYPFPEFDAKSSFICGVLGGGVKFQFAPSFATSLEWGTRTVFNDYLDGISKNGNPKANDWYMFGGLTLTYVVDGGDSNPYKGRKRRR